MPDGKDPVDEAIDAVQNPSVRMTGVNGTFDATGRPFQIVVPTGLTSDEARALAKVCLDLPERLAAQGRGSRIVLPTPGIRPS